MAKAIERISDMNMIICLMYVHTSFRARLQIEPETQIAVEIGVQMFPMLWPCCTRKKEVC